MLHKGVKTSPYKTRYKNFEEKLERENSKRTIYVSGSLRPKRTIFDSGRLEPLQ